MTALRQRARSIALRNTGDVDGAMEAAGSALETASSTTGTIRAVLVAEASCTFMVARLTAGDASGAASTIGAGLDAADGAATDVRALLRARCLLHRGLLLLRTGDPGWRPDHDAAIEVLAAGGDEFHEVQARSNRAVADAYAGRLDDARRDLERCIAVLERREPGRALAVAHHNLGFVRLRSGDVAGALQEFDHAERVLRHAGVTEAQGSIDRAEAYLAAGLLQDARDEAGRAITTAEQAGMISDLPEARLLMAEALLLLGDHAPAADVAAEAAVGFRDQDRAPWGVVADGLAARARLRGGADVEVGEVMQTARALTEVGRADAASELWLLRALRSVRTHDLAAAHAARACATPLPMTAPARLRVLDHLVALELAAAVGAADGVEEAGRAGVVAVREAAGLLGASELSAAMSVHVRELVRAGTRFAVASGDADRAWTWFVRGSALALEQAPVRPPDDGDMAVDLAALRALRADDRDPTRTADPAEIVRLESAIRLRGFHAAGERESPPVDEVGSPVGPSPLTIAFQMVAVTGEGEELVAVVADVDGIRRIVRLGMSSSDLGDHVARLTHVAGRAVTSADDDPRAARSVAQLDAVVAELRARILVPLGCDALADGTRVDVAPTGELFAVPLALLAPRLVWRVVPQLGGRREATDARPSGRVLAVSGPRLEHAAGEVQDVARLRGGREAVELSGAAATSIAVLAELATADVAHLACHGHPRSDSPQFSTLELADGPLFVHDLEALARVPDEIVLSACRSGTASIRPGDELLGMSASLLALGARTVVASVTDVADRHARPLMAAYHAARGAGDDPALALQRARLRLLGDGEAGVAAVVTACSFQVLGRGAMSGSG